MKKEMTTKEMLGMIESMSEEEKDQFFSECFGELAEEFDELFDSDEFSKTLNI